jgi:hypothetical protein
MESVIGAIGITAATTVINSITTLSSNVFTLMGYIKLSPHILQSDIIKVLNKSDIETTIRLLQSIISEIPQYYNNSTSVVIALKNVQEIIANIEEELKDIHNKILYNEKLYIMSNIRSYDFKSNLESIEVKVAILDRRRDNLFKTLEVFKNFDNMTKCTITENKDNIIDEQIREQ